MPVYFCFVIFLSKSTIVIYFIMKLQILKKSKQTTGALLKKLLLIAFTPTDYIMYEGSFLFNNLQDCNYVNLHLMSIVEAFYSYQLRYSQNRSICPFMNVQTLWAFLDFLKQLPSNANGLKCLPLLWYMIYYGRISCSVFATYRITTTIVDLL